MPPSDYEHAVGLTQDDQINEEVKKHVPHVIIEGKKVPLSDVLSAYGGYMAGGPMIKSKRKFGNAAPLGLCAFAGTTFTLSCYNVHGLGIHIPNAIVGMSWFYGGMMQLFAGMWELVLNNTLGSAAFSVYGFWWMAFAATLTPSFKIREAYGDNIEMFNNGMALFQLVMAIFSLLIWSCTLKSTLVFSMLFFMVFLTFLLLSIGHFGGSDTVIRAGGGTGIVAAILAWICALAGIAEPSNSYLTYKPIYLPGSRPQPVD